MVVTLLAGGASLALSAPASADSAEYFAVHSVESDVPALLPQPDREYYRAVFTAIDKEDWAKAQELFGQRKDGTTFYKLSVTSKGPATANVETASAEAEA